MAMPMTPEARPEDRPRCDAETPPPPGGLVDADRAQPARGASRLRIGITGHRLNLISRAQLERLTPALVTLMTQIAALAPGEGRLWLCSALADGTDQHVAHLALELGWALHTVLPFDDAGCEADCCEDAGRRRFRSLMQRTGCVTRLDGRRDQPETSYRQLGRAVVEASDLLIAVWDGEPARGPGGTAEVVAEALRRERPVLHLRPTGEPVVTLLRPHGEVAAPPPAPSPRAPFTPTDLRGVLNSLHAARE